MPYKIQHRGSGYKVTTPNHPQGFSKHPLSKEKAVSQLRAIKMHTDEMLASEIVSALLDEHCGKCPSDVNKKQLAMGRKVEREHTDSPKRAEKIAIDHLTEPDTEGGKAPGPKHKRYYSILKKSGLANELVGESDGPCPSCHPPLEGRRRQLEELGWRQTGWGWETTEWVNPIGTYYVRDHIIDDLPQEEWQGIIDKTNAPHPSSWHDARHVPKSKFDDLDTPPKADIMPGGSLGTVGGTTNSGASGIGGGL